MLAKVHLGYLAGARHPSATAARPFYGALLSERVKGLDVVHLWPHDFAANTRATTTTEPLATLWRPGFSGVLSTSFALSGLERARAENHWRWHAQRWFCEPMTRELLVAALERDERESPSWLRPGRVR